MNIRRGGGEGRGEGGDERGGEGRGERGGEGREGRQRARIEMDGWIERVIRVG